jgi:hypothetical protein
MFSCHASYTGKVSKIICLVMKRTGLALPSYSNMKFRRGFSDTYSLSWHSSDPDVANNRTFATGSYSAPKSHRRVTGVGGGGFPIAQISRNAGL